MEVIPAIDLLDGKAVRLMKGRYEDVTVYHDNPPVLAAGWAGKVKRLHVVDLEGARAGKAVQRDLVIRLVKSFGAGVQVGGGVRSFDAVKSYFDLGVERVVLGTAALRQPELVEQAAQAYPGRIIIAVDARNGYVATDGWLDQSERLASDLVRELSKNALAAALYTDIDRDGTEVGPNVEATARLGRETNVPVIASGGVGTLAHLTTLATTGAGIVGAIVGRALHEGRFSLDQAVQAAKSETPQ
ncbi:MAG TPA: 1-(5-phosphoribosyl)-5-[(5-phosphoribosylamino)methylideneamino]imidazole-4-carboxamide isomerase [Polyangiaceae bacterium]|jgi:phosphoribosylformimino-5-aminoimidazole carboxamide ribotide isomerase|nr:1-(5-phosphoribosyl)-5-[(5-phosphoribosylamino)methylideneamino]imidazole-4-carboxamide isomerase [Polyangiaceae bacterium]